MAPEAYSIAREMQRLKIMEESMFKMDDGRAGLNSIIFFRKMKSLSPDARKEIFGMDQVVEDKIKKGITATSSIPSRLQKMFTDLRQEEGIYVPQTMPKTVVSGGNESWRYDSPKGCIDGFRCFWPDGVIAYKGNGISWWNNW